MGGVGRGRGRGGGGMRGALYLVEDSYKVGGGGELGRLIQREAFCFEGGLQN